MTASSLSPSSLVERVYPAQLPLERKLPVLVLALFSIILGAWAGVSYYDTRHTAEVAASDRLTTINSTPRDWRS